MSKHSDYRDSFFEEFDFDWDALAEEASTDVVVDNFGMALVNAIGERDGQKLYVAIRMSSGSAKGMSEDLRNMIDEFEGFDAEMERSAGGLKTKGLDPEAIDAIRAIKNQVEEILESNLKDGSMDAGSEEDAEAWAEQMMDAIDDVAEMIGEGDFTEASYSLQRIIDGGDSYGLEAELQWLQEYLEADSGSDEGRSMGRVKRKGDQDFTTVDIQMADGYDAGEVVSLIRGIDGVDGFITFHDHMEVDIIDGHDIDVVMSEIEDALGDAFSSFSVKAMKPMTHMTDSQRAADLLKKGKVEDLNSVDVRDSEVDLAKKYCDYPCSAYPAYVPSDLDSEACASKASLVADLSVRLSSIKDGLLTAAAAALQSGQDYDEPIELLNALSSVINQLDYTESELNRYAEGEYKDMQGGPIKYTGWPYAIAGVADTIERIIGGLVGVAGFDATAEGLMAVRDMIRSEGEGGVVETEENEDESPSGITASAKRLKTKSLDDLVEEFNGVKGSVGDADYQFDDEDDARDFAEEVVALGGDYQMVAAPLGRYGVDITKEPGDEKSATVVEKDFGADVAGLFDLAIDSTSGESVGALQDARRLFVGGDIVGASDAVYDVVTALGSLCPNEIIELSAALDGLPENTEGLEGEASASDLPTKSLIVDEPGDLPSTQFTDAKEALREAGIYFELENDGWTMIVDDSPEARDILRMCDLEFEDDGEEKVIDQDTLDIRAAAEEVASS